MLRRSHVTDVAVTVIVVAELLNDSLLPLCFGQGRWQQHGYLFNCNTIEGFKTFDRSAAALY